MREAAADVPRGGQDYWRGDIGGAWPRKGARARVIQEGWGGDDDNVRWCTVLSGLLVCAYIILEAAFQEGRGRGRMVGGGGDVWSSCKHGHRSSLVVLHCTLYGIYLFLCVECAAVCHLVLMLVLMVMYFSGTLEFHIGTEYCIVEPAGAPTTVVLLVEHPLFPALVRGGCAYPFLTCGANPAGTSLTSNREFHFWTTSLFPFPSLPRSSHFQFPNSRRPGLVPDRPSPSLLGSHTSIGPFGFRPSCPFGALTLNPPFPDGIIVSSVF